METTFKNKPLTDSQQLECDTIVTMCRIMYWDLKLSNDSIMKALLHVVTDRQLTTEQKIYLQRWINKQLGDLPKYKF